MNGGEGFINDNYCRLYAIEDLMPLNEAYSVKEFAPSLLRNSSSLVQMVVVKHLRSTQQATRFQL
jgi:hypothetical protein